MLSVCLLLNVLTWQISCFLAITLLVIYRFSYTLRFVWYHLKELVWFAFCLSVCLSVCLLLLTWQISCFLAITFLVSIGSSHSDLCGITSKNLSNLLSLCLSDCLTVCLCVCLSVCQSCYLSVNAHLTNILLSSYHLLVIIGSSYSGFFVIWPQRTCLIYC